MTTLLFPTSKPALAVAASALAIGAMLGAAQARAAEPLILDTAANPETQGTGQGKQAIWRNVGKVSGVAVDLVATLVSSNLDHTFNTVSGAPAVVSVGQDPHEVRWEIYEAGTYSFGGTGRRIIADVHVQINDIDGPKNEQVFLPVCNGTVDYLRIDSNATTGRLFDNTTGVFTLSGDKGYSNEPESGLEINYADAHTFTFGRTANNGFLVRLANPTYLESDTLDLQCGDFKPIQLDPDERILDQPASAPVEFDILLNDSVAELNTSGKPSEYALQAVDLRSPVQLDPTSKATVSAIRLDAEAKDVEGFTVSSQGQVEGDWLYDHATGKLSFTPAAGFSGQPTPIGYRIRRASTTGDSHSAATSVTILSPVLGARLSAAFEDTNGDGATQPGEEVPVSLTVTNLAGLPVENVTVAVEGFDGAGAAPRLTLDRPAAAATLQPGDSLTFTGRYAVQDADAGRTLSLQYRVSGTRNGQSIHDLSDSDATDAGKGGGSILGPHPQGDDPHAIAIPALPPIDAVNDAVAGASGRSGATALIDLRANDTLTPTIAASAANTLLSRTDATSGPLTLNANGTVDLAAATKAGDYTLDYELCETANTANCDTARLTVSVVAAPLVATTDRLGPHVGRRSGAIDGAPSVLANDTIAGDAATTPEVTVTAGSVDGIGLSAEGIVSLDAPKPAGTYRRSYEICEALNSSDPKNCATGQIEIEVTAAPITATPDDLGSVPGRAGAAQAGQVLANDLLDAEAVDASEVTLRLVNADPQGRLTFDASGTLSLAAATPAGTYALDYEICEDLNPGNCAEATASIEALAAVLAPAEDVFSVVNRPAGHDDLGNLFANDLIDGSALAAADVELTLDLPAASPISVAPDGTVSVASETADGRYAGSYRICETLNPGNCAGPVDLVVELTARTLRTIELAEGQRAIDAYTPDPATSWTLWDPDAGLFEVDANGALAFAAAPDFEAPADANTDNIYEVTVTATDASGAETDQGLLIRITDLDEIAPAITGPATVALAENETAVATYAADEDASWSLSGADSVQFEIAADGTLAFATAPNFEAPADADADNVYEVSVTATDGRGNTSDLDVTVSLADLAEIAAEDDVTDAPVPGRAGAQAAIDVLANDTLNGARPTAAEVSLRLLPGADLADGQIALSPEGPVSVATGTPAGRYELGYEICAQDAPESCAQAGAVIEVAAATLALSPDAFGTTPVDGRDGGVAGNVLTNDTIDGAAFEADEVEMSLVAASVPGLSIEPDGALRVGAGTVAGTHDATYRICEILNPGNCSENTVAVAVGASEIILAADDLTDAPIYGVSGGVTAPVIANDLLGGAPVVADEVTMSITDDGGLDGVGIDGEGRITVPTFTEPGLYDVGYGVCEALNPANCIEGAARLSVVPIAAVAGTIFDDVDRDGRFEPGTDRGVGAGYRVIVIDADGRTQPIFDAKGRPVEFVTTDAEGDYELYVDAGEGYRVVMYSPAGEALGGFGIGDLKPGERLKDQNLPIDPSGVIYDSVTRAPIPGVRVTLTDAAGQALPPRCLADPAQQFQVTGADGFYRFDVAPAAAPQCPAIETEYRISMELPSGFVAGTSARLPVTSVEAYDATACAGDPIPGGNCEISASANPPLAGEAARYFMRFLLEPGDPNVINNHIAVDPVLADPSLSITALTETARRGMPMRFRITAEEVEYDRVDITDRLPEGFVYAEGSARVNGTAVEPVVTGRKLAFAGLAADTADRIEILLDIVAAGEIAHGSHLSVAELRDPDDGRVLARAEAAITLELERVFDCADLVGRVYADRDGDGEVDADEPGLAGALLRTPRGETINADAHGRFSVPCAMLPRDGIGSNMQLELDERSLPAGSIVTTGNPQVIRLTRGKMGRMDFGVLPGRQATLQITDAAFGPDGQLRAEWQAGMVEMMHALRAGPTRLGLVYLDPADRGVAKARLDAISTAITATHEGAATAPALVVETLIRGEAR
ncbi:DUF7507 domain-containing protein [Limimaricola sp.]|uniref:DUF7507 domain-containing protein n=1 Tax=Limimaricola sp. TaxID=2211665 RepID=UPI004059616E